MPENKDVFKQAFLKCMTDQDMFAYSGGIYEEGVAEFMRVVSTGRKKDKVTVLLTTDGGDPHAAYRMGRFLQNLYTHIRLLVVGRCKSAGTLVTIAADEVVFGPWGELGPLDVQVSKRDELFYVNSGLDTWQAFTLVTGHAYTAFENYMLQTLIKSGGAVSFPTACQVAASLTSGVIAPLAAQLDPHRLGEVDRMMAIATAYGERLDRGNLKDDALNRLVNDYPSHAFIIDMEEAKELFREVTFITLEEVILVTVIDRQLRGCCYRPSDDIMVFDVRLLGGDEAQKGDSDEEDADDRQTRPAPGDSEEPAASPAPPGRRANRRKGRRATAATGTGDDSVQHEDAGDLLADA